MRRKHEPRAIVNYMRQKTAKQPNFRLNRALRTVQGLDYLYCLRGLTEVAFWDHDLWMELGIKKQVRDFTFTMDVKNSVYRPKDELDRQRANRPAPTTRNFTPTPALLEALHARFPLLTPRACLSGFVPRGPATIVIDDSDCSVDSSADEGSDSSDAGSDRTPGPGFGPGFGPGGGNGRGNDDESDGNDDGPGAGAPQTAGDTHCGLVGPDADIALDFQGDVLYIDSDDDESTILGSQHSTPLVNPEIDLTRENDSPPPRSQGSTQRGESPMFVSDDEMDGAEDISLRLEQTPIPPPPAATRMTGLVQGTPDPFRREESSLYVSPTPYNQLVTPGTGNRTSLTPFFRMNSNTTTPSTGCNGNPGTVGSHRREPTVPHARDFMDLTEDQEDDAGQKRGPDNGDEEDQQESKRARLSQDPDGDEDMDDEPSGDEDMNDDADDEDDEADGVAWSATSI